MWKRILTYLGLLDDGRRTTSADVTTSALIGSALVGAVWVAVGWGIVALVVEGFTAAVWQSAVAFVAGTFAGILIGLYTRRRARNRARTRS